MEIYIVHARDHNMIFSTPLEQVIAIYDSKYQMLGDYPEFDNDDDDGKSGFFTDREVDYSYNVMMLNKNYGA